MNDRYGHQAGDKLYQNFAAEAARTLRLGDCFGRLGGDEFGVAIMVQEADEPRVLATSLQEHFTAAFESSAHGVKCSTGTLIVPATNRSSCSTLTEAADRLMYSSKKGGKNTVTIEIVKTSADMPDRMSTAPPWAFPTGRSGSFRFSRERRPDLLLT